MKAVIQRVLSASVNVDKHEISKINQGLLILLGVEKDDVQKDLDYVFKKIVGLRIFKDNNNKMNMSIQDVGGEILVVSQFTLCADTRKGRRPSFIHAAGPETAEKTYEEFCTKFRAENIPVQTGKFGAMMEVTLINDGPVTILFDSRDKG